MKWYRQLYMSQSIKNKNRLIWKVNHGKWIPDLYLVTLASNERNLMDIVPSHQFLQKFHRKNCPLVIGMADGYDDAVAIVQGIVEEVYRETGGFEVRKYLQNRV